MLSIETDMDAKSAGLENEAESAGHWKADMGLFNFSKAFNAEFSGLSLSEKQLPDNRLKKGQELLDSNSKMVNMASLKYILSLSLSLHRLTACLNKFCVCMYV